MLYPAPASCMTVSKAISSSLMLVTAFAFIAQLVIQFTPENIACASIILVSTFEIIFYLKWTDAIATNPLSTFAIFGFCVTTQLGALIAQSTAGTAVTASLRQPLYTFGTLAFYQAIAILVHVIYRMFSATRGAKVSRNLLNRAGLYALPASGQLWSMGFIGCAALLLHRDEGPLSKVSDAFDFLAWAPFLIPLYLHLHGHAYCAPKRSKMLLYLYAIFIALFGLATNARYIMFTGVATVGLLYLLTGMRSQQQLAFGALLKYGALAALLLTIIAPLSNLATAMAIARASRGRISAQEMMALTFEDWKKPEVIEAYRARDKKEELYGAYDESYIGNPILARVVETKFHDNALYFAQNLTSEDSRSRLKDVTIAGLWAALPSPLLEILGINVKKAELHFSMGDYLVYLSRGVPLGGYKAGSIFGQGLVLFGGAFPLVYAAICLFLFWLTDLLSFGSTEKLSIISPLALMNIWQFFLAGITADSLNNIFIEVMRGFPQMILVYLTVFGMTRWAVRDRANRSQWLAG
jgi:hypothetical protein